MKLEYLFAFIFAIGFADAGLGDTKLGKWCRRHILNDVSLSTSTRPSTACKRIIGEMEAMYSSALGFNDRADALFREDVDDVHAAWSLYDEMAKWGYSVTNPDKYDTFHLSEIWGKLRGIEDHVEAQRKRWEQIVKDNPSLKRNELESAWARNFNLIATASIDPFRTLTLLRTLQNEFADVKWMYTDEVYNAYVERITDYWKRLTPRTPAAKQTANEEVEEDVEEDKRPEETKNE